MSDINETSPNIMGDWISKDEAANMLMPILKPGIKNPGRAVWDRCKDKRLKSTTANNKLFVSRQSVLDYINSLIGQ